MIVHLDEERLALLIEEHIETEHLKTRRTLGEAPGSRALEHRLQYRQRAANKLTNRVPKSADVGHLTALLERGKDGRDGALGAVTTVRSVRVFEALGLLVERVVGQVHVHVAHVLP